jgi:hypothetical protein
VKLNRPPGGISPEDHWFPSAVDVCVVLSLLSQLIVVPAVIRSGFVPNAVVVCVDAPLEMVTIVLPAGAAVGVTEGLEGELYREHAVMPIVVIRITTKRRDMIGRSSCRRPEQRPCRQWMAKFSGESCEELQRLFRDVVVISATVSPFVDQHTLQHQAPLSRLTS